MRLRVILIGSFLVSASAFSAVNPQNGNFFINYTDVLYAKKKSVLKVERIYNSKAGFVGIFGPGWGTEFEAFVTPSMDGGISLREYGNGAVNRFFSANYSGINFTRAVGQVEQAAKLSKDVMGPLKTREYAKHLKSDRDFFESEWLKYFRAGKVQSVAIPLGTVFVSQDFPNQTLTKMDKGYLWQGGGKTRSFNEQGWVSQIKETDGNVIDIGFNKDAQIDVVSDSNGHKVAFQYSPRGLVSQLKGGDGKVALYEYNKAGNLILSKDVDGHLYKYAYDPQNQHSLSKISYADGTSLNVDYYSRAKNENVRKIASQDGTVTEYDYKSLPTGGTETLLKFTDEDRSVHKASYQYHQRPTKSGALSTWKIVATTDGEKVETLFNEACGSADEVRSGKEVVAFEYDAKCRVVKRTDSTQIVRLAYDPKTEKMSYVAIFAPTDAAGGVAKEAKPVRWSRFEYDKDGNIAKAQNSENKQIELTYTSSGLVSEMRNQDKHKLTFKYDDASNPISLTDSKAGTIEVASEGKESQASLSPEEEEKRKQVMLVYQEFLTILEPAIAAV